MRPKVYLAGPAEIVDTWRERAARELNKLGYDVINPMRGEKLRSNRGDVESDISGKLIVVRDHYDMNQVKLSGGFFLMNFNTTKDETPREPMATLEELEWAYIFNVPVIGIIGRDTAARIRNHKWINEQVTHQETSLTKCLELIEKYFSYEVGDDTKLEDEEE